MVNLLILLLMNIYLVQSSKDQVLIHGPETPVYNVTFVSGYVKVQTLRQKLPSVEAEYSYEEAIHPKLLVVIDYKDYINDGEKTSLYRARTIIQNINLHYLHVISTPRVEALLTGVVLMAEENVYSGPSTFDSTVVRLNDSSACRDIEKVPSDDCFRLIKEQYTSSEFELKRFTDWWKNTEEQFEDLDYDAFIYSFPYYLAGGSSLKRKPVWSLSNGTICTLKPGAIVTNRFGDYRHAFTRELAYLLGVTHHQDTNDSHYYTYEEPTTDWNKYGEWRRRTADTVEENYRRDVYSCLKKPAKKNNSYEEYDDE